MSGLFLSDSHCHFDFSAFANVREKEWQIAQHLGVQRLLIPAISYQQALTLADFCASKPWHYAYGLHPYFLTEHQKQDIERLSKLCQQHKPLAIGECGLDFRNTNELQKKQQWYFFEAQIELAKQHQLPLIIHAVKTHQQIISTLKNKQFNYGGIIHGFSGNLEQAKNYLALNFKLGIGGLIGKNNNWRLQQLIQSLPVDAFMLETDAPDMPPDFAKNNSSPAFIALYAQILAHLKKQPLAQVASTLEQQWHNLFMRD